MKKLLWKGILLFVILAVLIAPLSSIFVYKMVHRGTLIDGLYTEGDDYDVVLMGGSHMNGGIDPNVLWNQYGITSYNYATGGQPMNVTYYLLKEVLKDHSPSVVVLDLYYLAQTDKYGPSALVSNVLDNMKFSFNKLGAIFHCTPPAEWAQYLLPVIKYHFRWSDLKAVDFDYDSDSVYYTKGFQAGTDKYGKPDSTPATTDEKAPIPEDTLNYLNKIIDLSKQYDFQLMFLNLPTDYSDTDGTAGWADNTLAILNTAADLAEQQNIPYIDYNQKTDEIGLDFPNDMNNAGHLNLWGAVKVSTDFGNYLMQNFSLTDHRSDSAYADWDADYQKSQAASVS